MNQCNHNPLNSNSSIKNVFEHSNKISEFIENNKNNQTSLNLDKSNNSINSFRQLESDKPNIDFNSLIKLKSNAPLLRHSFSMCNNLNKKNLKHNNKKLALTTSFDQTFESKNQYLNENLIKSFTNLPCTSNLIDNYELLSSKQSDSSSINTSMIVNISAPILNNENKEFSDLIMPSSSSSLPSASASVCLSLREQTLNKNLRQKFCSGIAISNTVNFECNIKDNESKQSPNTLLKSYSNSIEQTNYLLNNSCCSNNNNNNSGYININSKSSTINSKFNNDKQLISNSPTINGYVEYDGKNRHHSQQQPFDLEDVFLLQYPILPPNSHFFCCFYKFHITAVAKVLSVIYAIFYGFLCVLSYKSQHAVAFLIAVLVTFSVASCTLYATFKWSKLCLIPFFLLQVMLVLYTIICVIILFYTIIVGEYSSTHNEINTYFGGFLNISTKTWIFILLISLIIITLFFCYSTILMWYEYQFIAEVDRFLKSIQKSSSQASKDDPQNGYGNNMAF